MISESTIAAGRFGCRASAAVTTGRVQQVLAVDAIPEAIMKHVQAAT